MPNPVYSVFELLPSSNLYDVQILSASGSLVLELKQVHTIDLSHYASGLYYVLLPGYKQTIKLIKE